MSKYVKQLQMKHLRKQFEGVTSLLVVNVVGMDALSSNQLRLDLRKKGIHLQLVKNTLARKVFGEMGLGSAGQVLAGNSAVAWGGEGIVELAKEITDWAKKIAKLEIKGACVDGQVVGPAGVEQLSKLPSRLELLGRVVSLANAPAARLVMLANAPARNVASQLKTMAEKEDGAES